MTLRSAGRAAWPQAVPATSVPPPARGQGMVEYIIIVALIAVAAIAVYSAFGKTVRTQSAGLAQELAGKQASMANVQNASNAAAGRANDPQKEGMGRYNYANDQN
jgi:Flp pilus assembly pilin Flp